MLHLLHFVQFCIDWYNKLFFVHTHQELRHCIGLNQIFILVLYLVGEYQHGDIGLWDKKYICMYMHDVIHTTHVHTLIIIMHVCFYGLYAGYETMSSSTSPGTAGPSSNRPGSRPFLPPPALPQLSTPHINPVTLIDARIKVISIQCIVYGKLIDTGMDWTIIAMTFDIAGTYANAPFHMHWFIHHCVKDDFLFPPALHAEPAGLPD